MKIEQHWVNSDNGQNKEYICAFCGRSVASHSGYYALGDSHDLKGIISICPNCKNPTYFQRHFTQIPSPPFGDSVPHVSDAKIVSLYEEARQCTSFSAFTSAVLLCRKIVMHIAVEKGATAERLTFQQAVGYLEQKGYIPPDGREWVDEIRKKGNEANHEIVLMSEHEARRVVRFTEMLLRFVYEMPALFKMPG